MRGMLSADTAYGLGGQGKDRWWLPATLSGSTTAIGDYTPMTHHTPLDDEQIKRILRGITVPPQPQIIVDIHMEQAMPNPDIRRIGKLISQDVGLAGPILKVVNSSLFGLKNRITSIEQAVQILRSEEHTSEL